MLRMLLVGYCFGIRSERRLCEEFTSTWRIAGSAGSGLKTAFRTTRASQRTDMADSARVMSSDTCLRV
jgi:hypothetical protein